MKAELSQALVNTVMGICTVVCVLVLIALVIYCFKFIPIIQKKVAQRKNPPQAAAADAEPAWTPPAEEVWEDVTDDLEIVAVIAAAIAAGTGAAPGSFTVRSIKRRV